MIFHREVYCTASLYNTAYEAVVLGIIFGTILTTTPAAWATFSHTLSCPSIEGVISRSLWPEQRVSIAEVYCGMLHSLQGEREEVGGGSMPEFCYWALPLFCCHTFFLGINNCDSVFKFLLYSLIKCYILHKRNVITKLKS